MGSVFQAIDLKLQRTVAIKVMHPEVAQHPQLKQRFIQEARSAAALNHPNIVQILEFHADGGQMYLVMEHVQGGSLRDYMQNFYRQQVQMHVDEANYIIGQTAMGLHFAHSQGMVHRDIKPDNVLLKPTTTAGNQMPYNVLLTDFGLAKLVDAQNLVKTAINQPIGTLAYMAPEQFTNNVDHRTDIYALGIMFYELVASQLPFMPQNPAQAMQMHQGQPPTPPSQFRRDLSPQLESIILKCLAKAPDQRYQSAQELAVAIQQISGGGMPSIMPSPPPVAQPSAVPAYAQPSIPMKQPNSQDNFKNRVFDEDTIIASAPNQGTREIPVRKDSLLTGRDPQIDIPLPGEKVSRHHARIDRHRDGTYTVTDLGSTNGTFFEGAQLLKDVPEKWPPGQELSVGEYTLMLYKASRQVNPNKTQIGGSASPQKREEANQPMKTGIYVAGGTQIYDFEDLAASGSSSGSSDPNQSTTTTQQQKPDVSINVNLEPERVYVEAGMVGNAQVHILNTGNLVKHCRLKVTGIDDQWIQVPGNNLQLLPGDNGQLPIVFRPPKEPSTTAGEHLFDIRILDENNQQIGFGQGILIIKPFYEFAVEMEPEIIRKRGLVWLTISNDGNARDSYNIRGKDKENGLRFFHDPRPVIIDPMTRVTLEIEVRPRSRVMIGAAKQYQFQLETTTASNLEKTKDGQLISPSVFPIWILPLLMLLCLGLLLLLLFLFMNRPEEEATVASVPNTATPTVDVAPFTDYLTATYESFDGTVVPGITATAIELLQSDLDDDGLVYADEINEYMTDPDIADTDGDGLEDGEEVNEYETDPLDDDSDDDNLSDGDEIEEYETDPNDDDSDNDDLTDFDEINFYDTDPNVEDSDRDTFTDGEEVEFGTNPNDRFDFPQAPGGE